MSVLRDLWNAIAGSAPAEGAATDAAMTSGAVDGAAQVTVQNPEINPLDIEQNYQVDSATEEVLAKIARGEMTAEEAMAGTGTQAGAETAGEVATETVAETAGEVGGEGLLSAAAPIAIPLAAGAAAFLIGEDSAVSDDEEKAMLAKSRGEQAAREAQQQGQTPDAAPAPAQQQPADQNQGPGDYEAPAGDSAPA